MGALPRFPSTNKYLLWASILPLHFVLVGAEDCQTNDDFDGDGWTIQAGDCDDSNPGVYPDAPEICDDQDNDCDDEIDEGVMVSFFGDRDQDGFGDPALAGAGCAIPDGCAEIAGDCDDLDPAIHPDALEVCNDQDDDCNGEVDDGLVLIAWYVDQDQDGFGADEGEKMACAQPEGFAGAGGDCDDLNPAISPAGKEVCDGLDNNCDNQVDEVDPPATWFADMDGDGFGADEVAMVACEQPPGYVLAQGDCNDGDPALFPGAEEVCDGVDNNCDGAIDEGLNPDMYYPDADGDGFGANGQARSSCTPLEGYVLQDGDCNDGDPAIVPGASELCDRVDNNCDGAIDEGFEAIAYFPDADGDGFGADGQGVDSCMPLEGFVLEAGDCNDADAAISPAAIELCDDLDNDCDGLADEALQIFSSFPDEDQDGFGDSARPYEGCRVPEGYSELGGDCEDQDPSINPGVVEVCDFRDNNCDGEVDEGDAAPDLWFPDGDGDGFGNSDLPMRDCVQPGGYVAEGGDCLDDDPLSFPGAVEICDFQDNNCDGQVDEGDAAPDLWYPDADGDGFGARDTPTIVACEQPDGHASNDGDCNDQERSINPGAEELCDGLDNNCDGRFDEGFVASRLEPPDEALIFFPDLDGDGFGSNAPLEDCSKAAAMVTARGDCDDSDPAVHPGARDETEDGIDQDCGGTDGADPHVGLANNSLARIQEAVDSAATGAIVWVGPGQYLEHEIVFGGKALTLASTHMAGATRIDAGQEGRVMSFEGGEGPDSVVNGFTLSGGHETYGGGIFVVSAQPTIVHCTLIGNSADSGGALYASMAAPEIKHCRITGNSATQGGGLFLQSSSSKVSGCEIDANMATQGAGVYLANASDTLFNSVVADNVAGESGGGLYLTGRRPVLNAMLVFGNSAAAGGGLYLYLSSPTIAHSAFVANDAQVGGGFWLTGGGMRPLVYNAVFSYNPGGNLFLDGVEGTPVLTMLNCDLFNPEGEANHNVPQLDPSNLLAEPGFLAYDEEGLPLDFHLALGSPLVDAGKANFLDTDGSVSDIGIFGGSYGDGWDMDADGVPDYFWPGDPADAPTGFSMADYDCDDGDPLIQACP